MVPRNKTTELPNLCSAAAALISCTMPSPASGSEHQVPTCVLAVLHADGSGLRRLPAPQTVVDVGGLPAGVLPVLNVLQEIREDRTFKNSAESFR